MAKKHRILLPVLALLLIGACSRNEEIEQPIFSVRRSRSRHFVRQHERTAGLHVCPTVPEPGSTTTTGLRTRWDKNDKIALWATADGSNYTLNAQNFSLAYFTPAIRPPFSIRRSPICRQEPIPTRPSARCPKASAARRYLTKFRQNRRAVTKGNGIFWPPIR